MVRREEALGSRSGCKLGWILSPPLARPRPRSNVKPALCRAQLGLAKAAIPILAGLGLALLGVRAGIGKRRRTPSRP